MVLFVISAIASKFFHLRTDVAQSLFCAFGALCCFLPMAQKHLRNFTQSDLQISVPSQRNRDSAVCALTLAIPMILDVAIEVFNTVVTRNKSKKIKMHMKQKLLNSRERLMLICGIFTIPITAFLPSEMELLVNYFMCLRNCRLVLVAGAVSTSLCRYDKNFWTVRKTYAIQAIIGLGAIIGAFIDNSIQVKHTVAMDNINSMLYIVAASILFYANITWLYSVYPILLNMKTSNPNTDREEYSSTHKCRGSLLFLFAHIATNSMVAGALVGMNIEFPEVRTYRSDGIFYYHLVMIGYLLFIMYISERMVKYEVIQGFYALIESKKMYVRYISHELRTPLNSAFLGLKLVCDEMKLSTDKKNIEHSETLLDVTSACQIAVEILNDLLCFDKLESGILELHKHEVPVIPFIAECVDMFASQAREGGVTLTNLTLLPLVDRNLPHTAIALLEDDTAFMDKFKMDQVLRNLISNALKFTPRGGSVSVCASFEPLERQKNPPRSVSLSKKDSIQSMLPSIHSLLKWPSFKSKVHANSMEDIELGVVRSASGTFPPAETSSPTSGKLRIVVTDSGAGISEANQIRLFKEIVQFNPEVLQAGGGSGLGLWITSSIVQMHSGTICVHSAGAGKGSTFTVEIDMSRRDYTLGPRSVPTPEREIRPPSSSTTSAICFNPPMNAAPNTVDTEENDFNHDRKAIAMISEMDLNQPPFQRFPTQDFDESSRIVKQSINLEPKGVESTDLSDMCVLVVDDSGLNRKLLCKLLRTSGCTCDEAVDGVCAVEKVRERMCREVGRKEYDVILMDFIMPHMDGPTATQAIRKMGYTWPIFGVTGNVLDSDKNHFTQSGVNAVLAKPFDLNLFKQLMTKTKSEKSNN